MNLFLILHRVEYFLLSFLAKVGSQYFEAQCFEKPLQEKLHNYSPARTKKLVHSVIPTVDIFVAQQPPAPMVLETIS